MTETGYAQSQGMMLLNRLVEEIGPLFTMEQAQALGDALALPSQRVRSLLSQLAGAGWIHGNVTRTRGGCPDVLLFELQDVVG